jgi:hypothetical protein
MTILSFQPPHLRVTPTGARREDLDHQSRRAPDVLRRDDSRLIRQHDEQVRLDDVVLRQDDVEWRDEGLTDRMTLQLRRGRLHLVPTIHREILGPFPLPRKEASAEFHQVARHRKRENGPSIVRGRA